jgi:hypothetical protein
MTSGTIIQISSTITDGAIMMRASVRVCAVAISLPPTGYPAFL